MNTRPSDFRSEVLRQTLREVRDGRMSNREAKRILELGSDSPSATIGYAAPRVRDHRGLNPFDSRPGTRVVLGLTWCAMAITTLMRAQGGAVGLRSVSFDRPVLLDGEDAEVIAHVETQPATGVVTVETVGPNDPVGTTVASARQCDAGAAESVDLEAARDGLQEVDAHRLATRVEGQRGPSLQCIRRLWSGQGRVVAELEMSDELELDASCLAVDPSLLDAGYVASLELVDGDGERGDLDGATGVWIPFSIDRVEAHALVGRSSTCVVRNARSRGDVHTCDIALCDDEGRVLLSIVGFTYRFVRYGADAPSVDTPSPGVRDAATMPLRNRVRDFLADKLWQRNGHVDVLDDETFMSNGMESMGLIELARSIEDDLGVALYPTLFFEHQTLTELVEWFAENHASAFEQLADSDAPAPQATSRPAEAGPRPAPEPAAHSADIAIIGMAGRFAGSPDLDSFWENLSANRNLISEVPSDRWDWREWFDEDPTSAGRTYSRWGSFIDVAQFDAQHFGVSPREARWMDPQLRLLLEVCHQAAEAAGMGGRLKGTTTGTFVGSCFTDYWDEVVRARVPIQDYQAASGLFSALAGRLSYTFDLHGPSVTVDAACASSLTALHLAMASLRSGESETALVAGVNLVLSPLHHVAAAKAMALSSSGQCHTFDARADGYVPGEGVAAVLLKPLDAAIRDHDPIQGVLKGSATNHNGRSNNPTAPSGDAQVAVLEAAWKDAGADADAITYLEAHGTGTLLGDPVELSAIKQAFSRAEVTSSVCRVGSVKPAIGHLEGAAGLASLIKVVLCMHHGTYVGMSGFEAPNPYLALDDAPFELDVDPQPWTTPHGGPRRAGISSFGLSGTNTHVVVEETPMRPDPAPEQEGASVLLLSAPSEDQLRRWADSVAHHIELERPALSDVAHTLRHGRETHPVRMAVVADRLDVAIGLLRETAPGTVGWETDDETADVRAARAWLEGAPMPGSAPGRMILLPPRPFRPDRHWFPISPTGPDAADATADREESTKDRRTSELYVPGWRAVGPAQRAAGGAVVLLGDQEALAQARTGLRRGQDVRVAEIALAGSDVTLEPSLVDGADVIILWGPAWSLRFGFRLLAELRRRAPRRVVIVHGHEAAQPPQPAAVALGAVTLTPAAIRCPFTVAEVSDGRDPASLVEVALTELSGEGGEVRLESGNRWKRQLTLALARIGGVGPDRPPFDVDGPWIVTGGLGALGRLLARHLAERFHAGLVLTGRSAPSQESERVVAEFRSVGAAHCEYRQLDVTDAQAVASLMGDVRARLGRIGGVIHAAGVADGRPWFDKADADIDSVLAPKVLGVRALDEATSTDDLAAFVVFSSASSALGGMGLDDYAAANRYLDAYVTERELRRSAGQRRGRSVSIAWPLWRDGGMHVTNESLYLGASGLDYLETDDALAAFDAVMASDLSHVVVLSGTHEALVRITTPQEGNAEMSEAAQDAGEPVTDHAENTEIVNDADVLVPWVSERLAAMAAEVLTVQPADIDPHENLGSYGFDSITLKELTRAVQEQLGVVVTPTVFYTYPTLDSVAEFIVRDDPDGIGVARQGRETSPHPPAAERVLETVGEPSSPPASAAVDLGGEANYPVAVIGMAGRFPGADDPHSFWQRLVAGDDLVTEVPTNRWCWEDIYSPERMTPGRTQSKWGAFLEGHDMFDADFFGISPREAELMDPQQRLFLETSWAALEDAGWLPDAVRGRPIGVFAGVQFSEYQSLVDKAGIQRVQVGTGNAHTMIPNRVSYFLDLRGPSESVDTGCSSSLVAIHRAIRALRTGDCEAALAGGVSLVLSPYYHVLSNQAGVLSPTGRCRTFDSSADGYVRGEGVGVLLLKPLQSALRDRDHVYAVLRGSAVNHGGRASSPTAPNAIAQGEVVQRALADARVDPASVTYVEAHGTGTELGDPIEVEGLVRGFTAALESYGDDHVADPGCTLGSVKNQIGHLEPAAGVASLIKVVLAMKHRTLPGLLHFTVQNPYLPLDGSRFRLGIETGPWRAAVDHGGVALPLRAGVSSFGFGGANAHVIVEEAPPQEVPIGGGSRQLVVLSARTADRLRDYAARMSEALRSARYGGGPAGVTLEDVAFTLQVGRHQMGERLAFVASTLGEAAEKLSTFAAGTMPAMAVTNSSASGELDSAKIDVSRGQVASLWRTQRVEELADLWVRGLGIDWGSLDRTREPRRVPLPSYPFARTRYWFESTPSAPSSALPVSADPLLSILREPCWVEAARSSQGGRRRSDRAWIVSSGQGAALAQEIAVRYVSATFCDYLTEDTPGPSEDVWFLGVHEADEVLPGSEELDSALGLLRLIRGMDAAGLSETPVRLWVVTRDVHRSIGGPAAPYAATCVGLARSAAREHPAWEVVIADIDGAQPSPRNVDLLLREPIPFGEEVRIEGTRLLVRALRPVTVEDAHRSPFRPQGVYLIVGGAGGVGSLLARHLAKACGAKVALLGRAAVGASHRELLDTIRAEGGEGLYIRCDVTDREQVRRAIETTKNEFGRLDGVIHSAMVLRDRTLRSMTDGDLRDVFAPKVAGLVALADALRGESLDFLLLMSSAQTFIGAAGQGNYAAASQFEDRYAQWLRVGAPWPVKVVNWGYWGAVGAVSAPSYARRLGEQGAQPIEPSSGLEVVTRLLASDSVDQVMAAQVDTEKLGQYVRLTDGKSEGPADDSGSDLRAALADAPRLDGETLRDAEAAWTGLADLTRRWLRVVATSLCAPAGDVGGSLSARLREWPDRAVEHDRLVAAMAAILDRDAQDPRPDEDLHLTTLREDGRRLADEYPGVRAHVRLLEACMDRYPELLKDEVTPTEVMFPGGRGDLLEEIYRGDAITHHFNRLVSHTIRAAVRDRLARGWGSIRILEVGAGTGATTEVILGGLGEDLAHVSYEFTDISAQLVAQAKARLGARYPRMQFGVLDIERDLAEQGRDRSDFDLVVATNVLHATSDVAVSVGRVREFLRPGGWLVLNEGTRVHDYATLTFGLLPGWWSSRDQHRRLPASPMIDRNGWLEVLASSGFASCEVLGLGPDAPETLADQQSVIVAVASGEPELVAAQPQSLSSGQGAETTALAPAVPPPDDGDEALTSWVTETVVGIIADILHVGEADLDLDEPHADRGVDSVMAIEIANVINETMKIRIRSTDLFNYPSPRKLVAHICREHGAALASRVPRSEGTAAPAQREVTADGPLPPAGPKALDIAVVGMSGQFAGARALDELWANLCAGRCSVGESAHWGSDNPYDRHHPGISYSRRGGFLDKVDRFDPLFFNISPREAEVMDPQHRLLLQESWRAIEDWGHSPDSLRGSSCGVYVGFNGSDYYRLVDDGVEHPDSHAFVGNSEAILAARLSYCLDLRGPSVTVNTACSSSLVAVDTACRALRDGSIDSALAGGVMIMTTPFFHHLASSAGMISPSGLCRTFSDDADGFIPGEGVGVVVLRRLEDAVADGDHIYGVIVGSGTNQDGQTNGIMAPSGPSQTQLELSVYERHGIDASDITYVEAHGTGTRLGDPIEVDALTDAFRVHTKANGYCEIGSIKSNIGHTLAAAGVAALIKTLMCLDHRMLVPTVNVTRENGLIDFENSPFRVNQRLHAWETPNGRQRMAAISSFGFSGTNAHLVVREAPGTQEQRQCRRAAHPVPVSARSQGDLRHKLVELAQWIDQNPDADLRDLAFTLAVGRSHFSHRAGWVVSSVAELRSLVLARAEDDHREVDSSAASTDVEAAMRDFLAGGVVDWEVLFRDESPQRLSLPTYPFGGDSYWAPTNVSIVVGTEGPSGRPQRPHPLLHVNMSTFDHCAFMTHLTREEGVVRDHIVAGNPTVPGVAQIEMVRAASEIATGAPVHVIGGIVWSRPIVVPRGGITVETTISMRRGGSLDFTLASQDGRVVHSQGRVFVDDAVVSEPARVDLERLLSSATRPPTDGQDIYESFGRHGLHYGPALQAIKTLYHVDGGVLVRLHAPSDEALVGCVLNPAVMDGALQGGIGVLDEGELAHSSRPSVPFDVGRIDMLSATPATGWALVRPSSTPAGQGGHRFDVRIVDDQGATRVAFHDLTMRQQSTATNRLDGQHEEPDPLEDLLSKLSRREITVTDARKRVEEMA